jgi:alkyl sulfatase BDS1-like metallo-beta-lactamase superfamily hydrolase
VIGQLTPAMLFDAIAIQVNGPAAWDEKLSIDIVLTDTGERYRLRLANGVLTYSAPPAEGRRRRHPHHHPQSTARSRAGRGRQPDGLASAGIQLTGDASALTRLTGVLDPGDKDFSIVTP